jgi:hypothetical protein
VAGHVPEHNCNVTGSKHDIPPRGVVFEDVTQSFPPEAMTAPM